MDALRAKFRWLRLVVLFAFAAGAGVLGCITVTSVALFSEIHVRHAYESPTFATAAEASQHLDLKLPSAAKNVRYATWRQWIGYDKYLRFEAPVEVCISYAREIIPDEDLVPLSSEDLARDLPAPESGVFEDLSWFDLKKAGKVVAAGEGSHRPRVWIDRERGVFYSRETD